jgi:hypothetical protein
MDHSHRDDVSLAQALAGIKRTINHFERSGATVPRECLEGRAEIETEMLARASASLAT